MFRVKAEAGCVGSIHPWQGLSLAFDGWISVQLVNVLFPIENQQEAVFLRVGHGCVFACPESPGGVKLIGQTPRALVRAPVRQSERALARLPAIQMIQYTIGSTADKDVEERMCAVR
jgi:hypothetical protein